MKSRRGVSILPAQVDVMFHEPHPGISGPAFLVVVANNVLVVGVRVLSEVSLDELSSLFSSEPEHHTSQCGGGGSAGTHLKKMWTRST